MSLPLNASATTAGALLSSGKYDVPPYQREYAWQEEQVSDFWNDLRNGISQKPYFLGLIILTEEGTRKAVVDGQQRIITLTLLAAALFFEAVDSGRKALAERIQSDFLRSIDYVTDETRPRVTLSDSADNATLQAILDDGFAPDVPDDEEHFLSFRMRESFNFLRKSLRKDLARDPFKRLGVWTDFITNHLYFAVFIHPDPASAYTRRIEKLLRRRQGLKTMDMATSSCGPSFCKDCFKRRSQVSLLPTH